MKKRILSLALVLALCMTLAVPAFADETTGTTVTLPESPDVPGVTASISNVLSVHTVALKQTVGYDNEADAPIEALIPTTVYTLAPTGAVLTVTNESEDYLFPGYDGCYTFQDGCYVTNPEFEGYGQCASFAPGTSSDYSLDCSADPANSDIYSLWICGGLSICYTYADLSDRSVEADPPETFGAYVNDFLLLNLTHAETRSVILDGSELDITLYYAAPNVYCLLTDYAGDPSFAPLMCTYYPLEGQVNAYDSAEMTDFPYTSLTITPDGEYGQFYRVWSSTSSVFIMLDPACRTEPTPEEPAVPDEPAAPVFADVAPGDYFADAVFWAIDRVSIAKLNNTNPAPYFISTVGELLSDGTLYRDYPGSKAVLEKNAPNNGYDPAKANEYLDIIMKRYNQSSFTLNLYYNEEQANRRAATEFIQANVEKIFDGKVKFELHATTKSVLNAMMKKNKTAPQTEWDLGWFAWSLTAERYLPWRKLEKYSNLATNGACLYNNQELNKLCALAGTDEYRLDEKKLADLTNQMEQTMYDDMTFIPVFQGQNYGMQSERIQPAMDHYVPGYGWGYMWGDIKQ